MEKPMRYTDDSSVADIIARLPLLKELPILDSVPEFLKLLKEHQVVIVEAETGSGKSTGLAPILVEAGYSVLQTQPRELGAYAVASRIAEVLGVELGKRVGYRTARQKQMDGPDTRCLVVTEGLSMVWRIQGHGR
jgi:HrpA-like RNA helicase